MREIKYRGRFDDICMVYGITDIKTSCKLMQYTGLKDKNGIDIYEGDIAKISNGTYGVIDYHGNSEDINPICTYVFKTYQIDKKYKKNEYCCSIRDLCKLGGINDIEVIGNIYENPLLLNNTDASKGTD